MDEVDKIIIHSLKSIGCDIEDEHVGLGSFTAELIYQGVFCCVKAIKMTECDVPNKLPPGMSQKFRAGSSLASLVKEVGYKGEIGYQTFLYSNEADIRKVLMFLVDKLPRDTPGSDGDAASHGSTQVLKKLISNKFKEEFKKIWLPHVCCQSSHSRQPFRGHELLSPVGLGDLSKKIPKDVKLYYDKYLLPVTEQSPNNIALCSALIENNALQLVSDQNSQWMLHTPKPKNVAEKYEEIKQKLLEEKEASNQVTTEISQLKDLPQSRFTQLEKLQHSKTEETTTSTTTAPAATANKDQSVSEEDVMQKQEQEIESLKNELQEITNRISKLNTSMEKAKTATEQTTAEIAEKKKLMEEQKKVYQVKKKTLDVLPEAEQTISKVKKLIDGADDRMKALEQQWLSHKEPLVKQIESLRIHATTRQATIEQKLAELQSFKTDMKAASEEAKAKDELLKSLTTEYQSMSKDMSRSSYTKRIIEIVANIKKQKQDIVKVLDDTRAVQKDINMLTGKLDRTFTVTDELIFKDAKRDEAVKAAYKYLASLHDNCNAVRDTIEETGSILREIRQLEDQIDQESSKDSASNLEKITADYKQIKKENQQLLAQLKK